MTRGKFMSKDSEGSLNGFEITSNEQAKLNKILSKVQDESGIQTKLTSETNKLLVLIAQTIANQPTNNKQKPTIITIDKGSAKEVTQQV